MSLRAATTVPGGTTVESEVAVIGAGPAGLALAGALAEAGVDVVLLEAGDSGVPAVSDTAFAAVGGESAATFRRDRRFGGTLWYGRCVAPDPIDFAPRAWAPGSGWPIPYSELATHLERAARWLGIERTAAFDPAFWREDAAFRFLDGGGLAPRAHLITRRKDLARAHRRPVAESGCLHALLGATLVGLDLAPGSGRVERARFAGADGAERSVRAGSFVLACGGLENARQLLLLDEAAPGRLGPSAAVLGEGFFDHPRCDGLARLHLDPAAADAPALYRRLVEHPSASAGCRVHLAAGIAPERQREEGLLNPCGFFYPVSMRPLAALAGAAAELRASFGARRLGRADFGRARRLLGGLPLLLAALAARARRRPYRLAHLNLVEQLEQAPSESGRVELAAERDRFGRRLLRVTWNVGDETRRTQRRFHELLAGRLQETGAGRLESPLLADSDFRPVYGDAAHPMGTTRMSGEPAEGVVDADARVHGLENLFVAGSSVIPTSGNANPTLTLVAMAFRLAARLVERSRAQRGCDVALV